MNKEDILNKKTLVELLVGAGLGLGVNLAWPSAGDGTPTGVIGQTVAYGLVNQFSPYKSATQRAVSTAAGCIGIALGHMAAYYIRNGFQIL